MGEVSRGARRQGLPGGRPHRLGDLIPVGPEISSHVDRSSLVGKKVLRITISMQLLSKVLSNLALQHLLHNLLFGLSQLLGQRLHSRVNRGKVQEIVCQKFTCQAASFLASSSAQYRAR